MKTGVCPRENIHSGARPSAQNHVDLQVTLQERALRPLERSVDRLLLLLDNPFTKSPLRSFSVEEINILLVMGGQLMPGSRVWARGKPSQRGVRGNSCSWPTLGREPKRFDDQCGPRPAASYRLAGISARPTTWCWPRFGVDFAVDFSTLVRTIPVWCSRAGNDCCLV